MCSISSISTYSPENIFQRNAKYAGILYDQRDKLLHASSMKVKSGQARAESVMWWMD